MSSINGPEDLERGELEQLVFAILDSLGWSASREPVDKSTVAETEVVLTRDVISSASPLQCSVPPSGSEPPVDTNPLKFQRRQIYEDGLYLFVDQTTRFPTWVFRRRLGGIWYRANAATKHPEAGSLRASNLSSTLPCIGPLTL